MREVQLTSKHKPDWLLGSIKFKNNKKFGWIYEEMICLAGRRLPTFLQLMNFLW